MKKEELFDLITDLKVDDKFIKEALDTDPDSENSVSVYARNTKRSPMRIIAPVAACLAVIAGAGIVLANNIKLPVTVDNNPASPASTTQSSTTESTYDSDTDSNEPGYTFIDYSTFPSQNKIRKTNFNNGILYRCRMYPTRTARRRNTFRYLSINMMFL